LDFPGHRGGKPGTGHTGIQYGGIADMTSKKRTSSAPYEPSFLKGKKGAVVIALLGLGLIAAGVNMYLDHDVRIGIDARTMQPKVLSGPYVGFFGLLLLVFAGFMWRKKAD
jgi:hypothetical protein